MRHFKHIVSIGIALVLTALASDATDFPPAEKVSRYSARVDGEQLVVTWKVETGYYLYRKRMGFESGTPGVELGAPVWPKGETHSDEYFGAQEIYRGSVDFRIPIRVAAAIPTESFSLKLKLQGCADAGLCYPPSVWSTTVKLPPPARPKGDDDLGALIRSAKRSSAKDNFLPPDDAFQFTAKRKDARTITLDWKIADGYYLYKTRIAIVPEEGARLGTLVLPAAERKRDEFLGDTEVYHLELQAQVPVLAGDWPITARVTYQGCAEAGLCYNPITKTATVTAAP